MNKLNNYIFLTICELSLKHFKESNYSTYSSYCAGIRTSIQSNDFSSSEKSNIIEIADTLSLIYNLKDAEIYLYIEYYFNRDADVFSVYQRAVMMMIEYYPMSFN